MGNAEAGQRRDDIATWRAFSTAYAQWAGDLNRHVPIEALGEACSIVAIQACNDALSAYDIEQKILSNLQCIGLRASAFRALRT